MICSYVSDCYGKEVSHQKGKQNSVAERELRKHCLLNHAFLLTCLAETSPLISLPPVPLGGPLPSCFYTVLWTSALYWLPPSSSHSLLNTILVPKLCRHICALYLRFLPGGGETCELLILLHN